MIFARICSFVRKIWFLEFDEDDLNRNAASSIIEKTLYDETQDEMSSRNLKTEEQIMQDKGLVFWIQQREQMQYGSRSLGKFSIIGVFSRISYFHITAENIIFLKYQFHCYRDRWNVPQRVRNWIGRRRHSGSGSHWFKKWVYWLLAQKDGTSTGQ